ncbi:MAG: sensor histidine kinase [Spirochaetia bacterium]
MQKKIFIRFVLIVVIPSGVIFFLVNQYFIEFAIKDQLQYKRQLVEEMRKNLDTKLEFYRQLTMQFYLNEDAMEQIISDEPFRDNSPVTRQLNSFVNSNRLISTAYLFKEGSYIYSGHGLLDMSELNREYEDDLSAKEGRILWTETRYMVSYYALRQHYFFGARHIRHDQNPVAALYIGFGEQFFTDFFENIPFEQTQEIIISSSDGKFIASNAERDAGVTLYKDYMNRDRKGGGDHMIIPSLSRESNWILTLVVSPREISRELQGIRTILYSSVFLYLLFFLYLSYLLSRQLSRPIRHLAWATRQFGQGNLNIRVEENHINEIKELSRSFNSMTYQIQNLITDVKHEEKEKRKAHMQTLQLQLTPHFLYNSLNSIKWMAQINGQKNIQLMTTSLIRFLKQISDIESDFITMGQELSLLYDYAVIQKYRYKNFTIIEEVPEDIKNFLVLKMILINLTENSILHGFHQKHGEGTIRIKAAVENERLVIKFIDDGTGINDAESDSTHNRSGLKNIRDRIQVHHGADYSITKESAPSGGCTITLILPVIPS